MKNSESRSRLSLTGSHEISGYLDEISGYLEEIGDYFDEISGYLDYRTLPRSLSYTRTHLNVPEGHFDGPHHRVDWQRRRRKVQLSG